MAKSKSFSALKNPGTNGVKEATVSEPKNKKMRQPARQPNKGIRAMIRLEDLSKRSVHGGRHLLFGERSINNKQ